MKFIPAQTIFLLILCACLLPSLLQAANPLPSQDISISFDLQSGVMQGNSTITLPPDMKLELYFGDLKDVRAEIITDNGKEPVSISEQNSISIPSQPQQQIFSLSWQLSAAGGGHGSGNLISPKGITLTGFWHPSANQDMMFSLTAELPKGFSGVSEADELTVSRRGDKQLLKAKAPQPLQSINFAAGPYTIQSRKTGSVRVYTYFFQEDAGLAADYLNKAASYINRYEKLIGSFPYSRYSIVENRLPTGYGMPAFTLLGQAVIRLPFIKDTSLGHEILHSWFGNALQTESNGNWCEGLTTYLADQSYAGDKGEAVQYRKNQLMRYQSYVHDNNITALIDFEHGGDSQPMARKMRAIGYDKASMFFHMLHRETGDKPFYTALRQLYADNRFQKIGWPDIETAFSKSAGRDLSLFFGQWLLRKDIPKLSIDRAEFSQKDGQSELSFDLIQNNETPYRLQVPVVIKTAQEVTRETVKIDSLKQEISLTVEGLPTELLIDPEFDIMRSLQAAERYPAWVEFMGAEQKTVVAPGKDDMERYLPLVASLERMGCKLVAAADLKNSELGEGSFIFLGSSSHTLSLFGSPNHPAKGFTLDVRKNPFNPNQVMALAFSSSSEETVRVVRKLSHYGKYSYLHFSNGRIEDKRMTPSSEGIALPLLTPPAGIPVQQVKAFSAIVDDLMASKIVYAGEMHTDYGSHLLQLQVIQSLYDRDPDLAIGMEMFPRSSQQTLDDYINGRITDEREFLKESNYFNVWGYDYRMYRDIIGFARKNQIPLVGLNLEKDIVSTVFRKGATDELTDEQLDQVAAERDVDLPGYRERLTAVHSMHNQSPHGSNFNGFLQAQSMWDETMAESIVNYLQAHPKKRMVVIAGTGHVYKDSAIPPRVARRMKIRQSVLIADNGVDRGMEVGKKLDYLMFTQPMKLSPAGKVGVVLKPLQETENAPAQIKIIQISPHGKAGQAGLKENDIIMAVDGFTVTSVGDLKAGIMDKGPGDTVTIQIKRKDEIMDIEVELSNMDTSAMMMPPGHPKK